MKRWVVGLPALLLLAGCAGGIVDPVQTENPGRDALEVEAGSVGSHAGTLADATPTSATVIDFESLAAPGTSYTFVSSYSEDGFTIVNPGYSGYGAFVAPESDNASFLGSTSLANNELGGVTLLTKDDGGTFTVASIDIAEFSPAEATSGELSFTGTRADGSTTTATFTMDGVAGFETFTFQGFTDLISFSWVQAAPYHQFDNVTLDPMAFEPNTGDGPATKQDCIDGGWDALGFRNQGQCVRMVETGKDSR